MARAGVYRSEVKKARDALLAKGQKPSIDAVRIELGNTGSKTTIHKYLRELDEDEGNDGEKRPSLSDALSDLVERLSARLQEEADERYNARVQVVEANALKQHIALQAVQAESARLAAQASALEVSLGQREADLAEAREKMTLEATARQLAQQQVASLSDRLAENETHRLSLEEKHQHARDALEHYRQAAKEQREAESRRHEQQVQQLQAELRLVNHNLSIKHDEVTRLNREGAALIAEATHLRHALHSAETNSKRQGDEIKELHARTNDYGQLRTQFGECNRRIAALQSEQDKIMRELETRTGQLHALELAYAQMQAQAQTQERMNIQLQALLASAQGPSD